MTATRTAETFLPELQIDLIHASSTNPRQHFDPAGLDELKRSIEQLGIQVPLLLRQVEAGGYELVSGERRLRAAQLAGMATVPAIVREMSEDEVRDVQIVENLQRLDVHPVDEAEAYRSLIAASADRGEILTAEEIARRVSKKASHVAQLLKLLELGLDAKVLFSKGHITLGHALMLAKLTPVDQERALRFMLDSDPKHDKRTLTEVIRTLLGLPADGAEQVDGEEGEDADEGVSYNMPNPQVAKYMRHGRRLVDATEAQLKRWIESNVLLKLADVPWRLEDEDLVVRAGACDVCPKRSGSNIALFGALTADEDVCTDPVCFGAKQKAFIAETARIAKSQNAPLAKLTSKHGEEKLPEVVTERTILKAGQWLAAEAGSCPSVVSGLMRDGVDGGKTLLICANQSCKVHKHSVYDPSPLKSVNRREAPQTDAQRAEAAAKQKAYAVSEGKVRVAVLAAVVAKAVLQKAAILRALVQEALNQNWNMDSVLVADALGIGYVVRSGAASPEIQRVANDAIEASIKKGDEASLLSLAVAIGHAELFEVGHIEQVEVERKGIAEVCKVYGVDSKAIAAKVSGVKDPAKVSPAKKVAAKAVKKKPAVKKVATPKKTAPSKKLSAEGRKRIADAMAKRWAARQKQAAK